MLIVSWVTPTPGCTAKCNFQGNRYSQPLILRPFGRSGRELPVEYLGIKSNNFPSIFSMSTSKKGCRQGPASGNSTYTGIPSQRTIPERQYHHQNHRKITYEKSNFLCVYPLVVFVFCRNRGRSEQEFFMTEIIKTQKLTQLQRGQKSSLWTVTTIKIFLNPGT